MASLRSLFRIPRLRYLRKGSRSRRDHSRFLNTFIDERETTLDTTGAAKTFTLVSGAIGTAASATLTFSDLPASGDTVTIGDEVYVFGTNQVEIVVDTAATGILTAEDDAVATETVTVGSETYTFVTTLTDPAEPFEVLCGADATEALANLAAAINAGAGEGTVYGTGTTANADATAEAVGTVLLLTATAADATGNTVVTTETCTNMSFAEETLTGGLTGLVATRDILLAEINSSSAIVTASENSTNAIDIVTVRKAALTYETSVSDDFAAWGGAAMSGGADGHSRLAISSHGYSVGDGPFVASTSGTLPTGISTDTLYYVKTVVDSGKIVLTADRNGGPAIEITAAGSGTQTLTKAEDADAIFELMKQNNPSVVANATDIDAL